MKPHNAAPEYKKTTREKIFETAVELFAAQGFHATTVRQIAGAVGIKESSLYNHYKGKDAILAAILEYYSAGFQGALPTREEMDRESAKHSDPLSLWLSGMQQFIEKSPPLLDRITCIMINEMQLDPRFRRFVVKKMMPMQKEATRMLIGDMCDKGFTREIDVDKVATTYVYMLWGMGIEHRLLEMEGTPAEELQQRSLELISHFVEGLRRDENSRPVKK